MAISFCDTHAPRQRGTNENTGHWPASPVLAKGTTSPHTQQVARRFRVSAGYGSATFSPRVGIDPSGWPDERLDGIFKTYLVAYEAAWRSVPDAEPCLGTLRRVAQIAVPSNGNQGQQEEKVSRTGLGRYIDVVLTSDQLGVAKPDRRVFELTCGRLGVPTRAPDVGDQLKADALAATAAGLREIGLNHTGGTVPSGRNHRQPDRPAEPVGKASTEVLTILYPSS